MVANRLHLWHRRSTAIVADLGPILGGSAGHVGPALEVIRVLAVNRPCHIEGILATLHAETATSRATGALPETGVRRARFTSQAR